MTIKFTLQEDYIIQISSIISVELMCNEPLNYLIRILVQTFNCSTSILWKELLYNGRKIEYLHELNTIISRVKKL